MIISVASVIIKTTTVITTMIVVVEPIIVMTMQVVVPALFVIMTIGLVTINPSQASIIYGATKIVNSTIILVAMMFKWRAMVSARLVTIFDFENVRMGLICTLGLLRPRMIPTEIIMVTSKTTAL